MGHPANTEPIFLHFLCLVPVLSLYFLVSFSIISPRKRALVVLLTVFSKLSYFMRFFVCLCACMFIYVYEPQNVIPSNVAF